MNGSSSRTGLTKGTLNGVGPAPFGEVSRFDLCESQPQSISKLDQTSFLALKKP
jgi:hypothetical protein